MEKYFGFMPRFLILLLFLCVFSLHCRPALADDEKDDEDYLWFLDPLWGVGVIEFQKTNYYRREERGTGFLLGWSERIGDKKINYYRRTDQGTGFLLGWSEKIGDKKTNYYRRTDQGTGFLLGWSEKIGDKKTNYYRRTDQGTGFLLGWSGCVSQ